MKQNDDLEKFFKEAKQRARELERDKVNGAGIDPSEKQTLHERLYRMIQYAIGRHDWYDNQRHRFLQIGLALMAAGAAIGAVFATILSKEQVLTQIFAAIFVISIFYTGLRLVYLYNKGIAGNYPYRKIADIRSWYFVYNFPSGLSVNLSSHADTAKRQVNETIDGLKVFLERWLELVGDRLAFVKEDLEQVFILQLLQRYRYQQVKKMSGELYKGLRLTSLFLVLIFASFIYYNLLTSHSSNQNVTDVQIESTRSSLPPTESQATEESTTNIH